LLELRNIIKDYKTGDSVVRALDGITLKFRESEFVSILGPSGCGKTTLLNIVGGLDQYTSGDLVINGVSTKQYKDADWDTYRNHSIGFVFQSYNLIPHQTVLSNVELALTLSGISKKERRARAKQALIDVGLGDHIHKRPNQLSGGQMQRVAIARALVNDPDILLADEPTGALDTKTSVQIMDILRSISHKKLIIMVTHNPDLAKEYSSRIISVVDGHVVDDTDPFVEEEASAAMEKAEPATKKADAKKNKKKSMSFFTALSLSLNNLLTKKGRTFMTSFAGSIGIIGIALILAVSTGVNNYITAVQRDTLSTYPLTINRETQDYTALLAAMTQVSQDASGEVDDNKIYVDDSMGTMMSAMTSTVKNNLEAFKKHIEEKYEEHLKPYVSDIQYSYDYKLQIYTGDGKVQVSPTTMFDNMGEAFSGVDQLMEMGGGFGIMSEMINNQELLDEQYELVGEDSRWPEKENEIVLVVSQNNRISKMTLYMLGVLSQEGLDKVIEDLLVNGKYDTEPMEPYALSDFLGKEFLMLNTSDFFKEDPTKTPYKIEGSDKEYPVWYDMRTRFLTDEEQIKFVNENGTKLVISGIVRPRAGVSATSISTPLAYTKALTDSILRKNEASAVLNQQKATPEYNVLTGLKFERTVYTRENIDELISKVDDATMEQLYAWMTQEILNNPENTEQLKIENKESFLGFFMLMPEEQQYSLVEAMMQVAKQIDPAGSNLEGIFTTLTTMLKMNGINDITVTADNFLYLMPQLSTEQIMLFLNGMPASEQEFNGVKFPVPAVPGLIDACGEQAMKEIYAKTSEGLLDLTINDEIFTMLMQGDFITDEQFKQMEETLYKLAPQTDETYTSVLSKLGDAEAAKPSSIRFFAKDFESKDMIEAFINEYNESVEEVDQIKYTDMVKTLMSSVTTIVNAISYVLIAFVAISLVVSSIMIGIITYISVLERTKEIGILRSIGASKRDVSRVFNAETLIVGFVAGLIGILVSLALIVVINIILFHFTGIAELQASLPPVAAAILVGISMFLTFIAGLFPSGFAAKRNPVEALRSE